MDIYWAQAQFSNNSYRSVDGSMPGRDLCKIPPENLYKNIVESSKTYIDQYEVYIKCPAAIEELSKTFIIRSDIDVNFVLDKSQQQIFVADKSQEFAESLYIQSGNPFHAFNLAFNYLFYSEKSVNMTILPAYMHLNEVPWSNYNVKHSAGSFDISKWFRASQVSLISFEDKLDIKIKRKDPLFYVRFETPEKINLQEFRANSKIEKLAAECAFAKHYIRTNKLSKIYNLFINRKLQTPILKEIKKNLV